MNTLHALLQCPKCRGSLESAPDELRCQGCGAQYPSAPLCALLPEGLNEHKQQVTSFFADIATALEQTPYARFVTYQNWGYAENGSPEFSQKSISRASTNYYCMKLLAELIADYDLSGKRILEAGCGRGGNLAFAGKFFQPALLFGIDLAAPSIAFCQKTHKKAHFLIADAEHLPFADGSFDCVLSIESASDYPHVDRFYHHAHRVLTSGGRLLYADVFFAKDVPERERELRDLGFSLISKRDVTENVLLAITQNAASYVETFETTGINATQAFRDTMGWPDTPVYRQLQAGERRYLLYQFEK